MTSFLPSDLAPDWLDDIEGDRALEWARERSAETTGSVPADLRGELEGSILAALDSDTRIPLPVRRGEHLYNFWRDGAHPRGLWRRTSLESFVAGGDGEAGAADGSATDWEVVLDLDALAEAEGENWVWKGAAVRRPDYRRALVHLSRGGADATVIREFDLEALAFVDEDPFTLPEAKSDACWLNADEILVGTDMGPGSLTDSGYPRQVRRWRRGTPLAESEVLFSGHASDVAVGAWYDATEGFERLFVDRALDFYDTRHFVGSPEADGLQIIEVPEDCRLSVHREWLLLLPRSPFLGIAAGGAGVIRLDDWLAGSRDVEVLVDPAGRSLEDVSWTRDHLVLTLLEDVATVIEVRRCGDWTRVSLEGLPDQATVGVLGTSPSRDGEVWFTASSALQPTTLLRADLGEASGGAPAVARVVRRAPAFFDASGMETRQHWAVSDDGTRIPYRVTGVLDDGPRPTLVTAYGGFEVSLVPGYSAVAGLAWLSRGGISVQANIRGGGEFGPEWHSSVVKRERPRVYEDHRAVLRDIVERGYATVEQLAVRGGSNGGLLAAVCLTSYPELVGAVVSQVPLADMLRYHRLSAGASWMAEYGDPDEPGDREVIASYSPVQRVARRADREYPPALVTTSTRDDRVHPAHARTLAWLLREAGQPVDYHENTEGGHAGAADNAQVAHMESLIHAWLWDHVGGEPGAGAGGAAPADAG
ncbi:prolyl oligopeptidase family serine peptidase [Corynebacterium sp. 335C]